MPDKKYPTVKDFLAAIKPYAMAVEVKYGIPWLFTATQAAEESSNGNSKCVSEANNLFGMTGDSWMTAGKPVWMSQTKEYNAAHEAYFVNRPFRKYADWTASLQDWVEHIVRMYPKAYEAAHVPDAAAFFDALQAGGYATDPKYAAQLKERYGEIERLA